LPLFSNSPCTVPETRNAPSFMLLNPMQSHSKETGMLKESKPIPKQGPENEYIKGNRSARC
jgi:hypothetical protein